MRNSPDKELLVPDTWIDVNKMLGLTILDPGAVRGEGHTTHQILTAPKNAWFVWCNQELGYLEYLCHHLRRTDLWLEKASWIKDGRWMRDVRLPRASLDGRIPYNPDECKIVIDHAFYQLEENQRSEYDYVRNKNPNRPKGYIDLYR